MTPDQYSPDYMAQGDCHDCGIPYGSPRFPDLVVPHDQWAKISPSGDENGLLCPNCMCARAESAGVECRAIFRSGPFFDAHPVHQPAHDAVARLVEAAQFARNRLEIIASDVWNGDARDFKRSLVGVFSEFDAALAAMEANHDPH